MSLTIRYLVQSNLQAMKAAFCDEDAIRQRMQQQIQSFVQQFLHPPGEEPQSPAQTLRQPTTVSPPSPRQRRQPAENHKTMYSKNDPNGKNKAVHSADDTPPPPTTTTTPIINVRGAPFKYYRRSISENFRDRVYFETTKASSRAWLQNQRHFSSSNGNSSDENDDWDSNHPEEEENNDENMIHIYT